MDSVTLSVIVTIIISVIVVDIYKRQKDRITVNLHGDNLKQLLTITALDYKYGDADNTNDDDHQLLTNELTALINSYEKAEISQESFQKQMDYLINTLN
ncbi:hypothetical protein SAMN05216490_0674 [Mucilaginibacter mallensis]|uniref:Uncharacterized protein n=1 Tax=Mucilaginibacter mallensis TaxID=652787 RepID=A0A1H1Q397_MUCMA|nr:hypothetical protein [Mucilaginibacter mallensis]SDS17469.1 hypothetical protein SAMN05216490_0674 [Mucilaginibacter mallensis]